MTRKKHSNPILDNPDNGGIHSTRRLKSVHTMMTTHALKDPVVYQFILSGKPDKADYQATIKALLRHIRTKCKAEYVGAYEVGSEKGGLHCHCYVIIETAHHFPGDLLDVSAGKWIARRIARTGMSIRIESPKAPMHGGAMFARMNTPAKLADAIAWVEYHVKGRSKDVPGRETYFASEFASNAVKREAKRQKYRDALEKSSKPAQATPFLPIGSPMGRAEQSLTEKETQHDRITTPSTGQTSPDHADSTSQTSGPYTSPSGPILVSSRSRMRVPASSASGPEAEAIRSGQAHGGAAGPEHDTRSPISPGEAPMLTTAQKYIASRYEEAVDLQLDLEAMRRYLLDRGIKRTPAALVFDLDEVYGFHDYAASHPAPPAMTLAAIDKSLSGWREGSRDSATLVSHALQGAAPRT